MGYLDATLIFTFLNALSVFAASKKYLSEINSASDARFLKTNWHLTPSKNDGRRSTTCLNRQHNCNLKASSNMD